MWLLICFVAIILILYAYLDTRKPHKYPPGPKWLPIIGSSLALLMARKQFGNLCHAFAYMSKIYGPIMGYKAGRDLLVVIHGHKEMKEFFMHDDLSGRPDGDFFVIRTWGQRKGILLTDGPFWQEQRRFVLRQLREFGFGRKNMSLLIENESHLLVEDIKRMMNNNSLVVHMNSFFSIPILNTMWMMMAGIRYNAEDSDLKLLQSLLKRLFIAIDMFGAPFSQFPILKLIAPKLSGYELYIETHSRIWEFLNDELMRHKKTHNPDEPRDFIDVYLNILNSTEQKATFSEKQLLAICLDIFVAGSETTTNTLVFGFFHLLFHPEIQKKAQEEIDRVVGSNRLPMLEDRVNMPYVECVVLESIRTFAGRAFNVPHRATKTTTLCGYTIPKDTILIANMNGSMMDPSVGVENPDAFYPERYLKDGKVTIPESFLPFGLGKHRCMGETMAKANLFLFTATLLQHFNFNTVPGQPYKLKFHDGVTPSMADYKAVITPRA